MTRSQAMALADSHWWEKTTPAEAALFQLFEERLCMPFDRFHEGVEQLLGRPVFTHEFAYSSEPGGLRDEATGKAKRPTLDQILTLVPAKKRLLVVAGE
jgi:hypothetical protein